MKGRRDKRIVGIDERSKACGSRQQLVQEPEPFRTKLDANVDDPGGVAARMVEASDQASFHGIGADDEDDGDRHGCRLGRDRRSGADRRHDDCHAAVD